MRIIKTIFFFVLASYALGVNAQTLGVFGYQKVPSGGGGAGTPIMFEHISSSTNPVGNGIPGHAFKIPVGVVPASAVIVLGISYVHGKTVTISDTLGLTWPAATCTADAGTGNYVAAVYAVYAGASGGSETITVNPGTTNTQPFQYVVTVFQNIATSSFVNGHLCTANLTPNSSTFVIGPGSFTPTNNDANGGNVIWNYTALCGAAGGNPTNWTPQGSFGLLNAEIAWTNDQGFPEATEDFTQTTAASVTPSIASNGDSIDCFNSASIALAVANNSSTAPSTIHVAKISHESMLGNTSPGTLAVLLPTVGNLRVLTTTWTGGSPGGGAPTITSVTTSDCTWSEVQSTNAPMFYAQNCPANGSLTVTLHFTGSGTLPQYSFRLYDIQNAAASSFDTSAGTNAACGTSVTNAPSITPGISAGLTIAAMGNGNGPVTVVSSPTGAVFDLILYTGQTDTDLMDNADASSHFYFSTNATQNWNYTKANGADQCYSAAATFK